MVRYIKPQTAILFAILILTIPLPWLSAWVLAAIVHEAGHCIGVWICGGHLEQISLSLQGTEILSTLENRWQAVFCSLAGPIGGMLLFIIANQFPRLSICAFLQTIYNLLPIYPLDGGRMVYNLLLVIFPVKMAENVFRGVEFLVITSLVAFAMVLCFALKLGCLPVLFVIIFLVQTKRIKIPCKWRGHRVQ